jgi:hypothetical protein
MHKVALFVVGGVGCARFPRPLALLRLIRTIRCLSDAALERPARERRSAKVTTVLLFRCGARPQSLRFYRYEEINNNITSSFVLYTWRCRTRRGSACAGYHGPTTPESTRVL